MSIYCSIFDFGYEHPPRCERITKIGKQMYREDDSKPCTCGSCPLVYQGSNRLPSNRDKRGGAFALAAIPSHITRDGRDNRPEGGPWQPWLRVSLHADSNDTVIFTRKQAEKLRDALSEWLHRSAATGGEKEN